MTPFIVDDGTSIIVTNNGGYFFKHASVIQRVCVITGVRYCVCHCNSADFVKIEISEVGNLRFHSGNYGVALIDLEKNLRRLHFSCALIDSPGDLSFGEFLFSKIIYNQKLNVL